MNKGKAFLHAIYLLGGLASWILVPVGICWLFVAQSKGDLLLAALCLATGIGLVILLVWRSKRPDALIGAVLFGFFGLVFGPILGLSSYSSKDETCSSNLSQLQEAIKLYAQQNDDRLPPASSWRTALRKHQAVQKELRCPESDAMFTYAMNSEVSGRVLSELPAETVILFEAEAFEANAAGGREWFHKRHHEMGWVLTVGRVARSKRNQKEEMGWNWKLGKEGK